MSRIPVKKILISVLLLLMCIIAWENPFTVYAYNSEVIIEDKADLLSENDKKRLDEYARSLDELGNVAILTTLENDKSSGEYISEFCKNNKWENQSNIIFLIDLDNYTANYQTQGKASHIVSQEIITQILGDTIDYISQEDYYAALRNAIIEVEAISTGCSIDEARERILIADKEELYVFEEVTADEDTNLLIIQDDAELFDKDQLEEIAEYMRVIAEYGHVVFVTTDTNDTTAEAYCRQFAANYWEDGESSTMFLIDMKNRVLRIQSEGYIYEVVTDDYADTITDNIYELAADGDYLACTKEAFDEIASLLKGQRIAQPMKYICNLLLALVSSAFMMFCFVIAFIQRKSPSSDELIEYIDYNCNIYDITRKRIAHNLNRSSGTSDSGHSSSGWSLSGGGSHSGSSGHSSGSSGHSSGHSSGGGGQHRF